jgi:hypothetical protein
MAISSKGQAAGRFQAEHTSTDGLAFTLILMRTINQRREARDINTIFCSVHRSRIVPVISRYLHTRLRAEAIQSEASAPKQALPLLSAEELIGILTLSYRFVSARWIFSALICLENINIKPGSPSG